MYVIPLIHMINTSNSNTLTKITNNRMNLEKKKCKLNDKLDGKRLIY